MFKKTLRLQTRAARFSVAACVLGLTTTTAALAQNPAPGTAPIPPASSSSSQAGQTGTAAPGTAPMRPHVSDQAIAPVRVPTYDERWELFGGLSFMNGQAGQNLPNRYNMGGGEVMGTYWLGPRLGVSADYRLEAGTTPVLPVGRQFGFNRVAVYQNILSGGVEYRGPKNRYAAVDYHALFGASHGTFDSAITNYPPNATPQPTAAYVGLYNNSTTPWGAVGGSIDFNASPKWAVRLSPDLIFEHFGTELREFFSIGGGVVYRFGKRR